MSDIFKTGGPAFPVTYEHSDQDGSSRSQRWEGMSLRDWFFGKALKGIVSGWGDAPFAPSAMVARAWLLADEAIAQREKKL